MPHPPQIPLTPQTDERNFPRWEGEKAAPGRPGARYPKMLTRTITRQDRDEWVQKHRRVDQNTRQEYWEEAPPRINAQMPLVTTQDMVDDGLAELANQPIIVNDSDEERRVLEYLGRLEPEVKPPQSVSIPIRPSVSAAPLSDDWVQPEPAPKKRGRPPKNKPLDVSN